jgi:hypothetical protein
MNIRYFIVLAALALFNTTLSAQDLLDKLAEASCDCISKKDTDSMSSDDLQMQMGFCIMEAVSKYPAEFEKEYGDLNPGDQQAMTKLGEDIGMRMAAKCPAILMKIATVETQANVQTSTQSTISGTLKAVEGDDFSQLIIEDPTGRRHKILWMGYFKGSERLIESPEKALGRKVTVTYEEVECYSPKVKDYINCKEAREVKYQ